MRLLLILSLIPSLASAATCYSGISCLGAPITSGVTGQECLDQGARSYFSDTYQRCFESWEDHQQLDQFEWAPRSSPEPNVESVVPPPVAPPAAEAVDACEEAPWQPECPGAQAYCDSHAWESPCVELSAFCLGHPWEPFCVGRKPAPLVLELEAPAAPVAE